MAGINTSLQLYDMVSAPLMHITSSLNMCISEFEQMQSAANNSFDTTNFASVRSELNAANIEIDQMTNNINESDNALNELKGSSVGVRSSFDGLNSSAVRIASAIYTVQAAIQGISKVTNLSDDLSSIEARLNMITGSAEKTKVLQEQIFDSADRTRSTYIATADAVGKLGVMASGAFGGTDEILAFAEQVNKQFVLSGTSAEASKGAWIQLTQAMGSGTLRGDELNSIFDAAPTILQSVSAYIASNDQLVDSMANGIGMKSEKLSENIQGHIKDIAEKGLITAEIVKNAMFYTADKTNAKFNSMPMTFSQAVNSIQNRIMQTMLPVMQIIAKGAQLIADNWSKLEPVFVGLGTGLIIFTGALIAHKIATWLAVAANRAFMTSLLTNPLFYIVIAIGVVISMIYRWIQAVGGLEIAWLIACDKLMLTWSQVKILFISVVYGILDVFDQLNIGFLNVCTGIANLAGDLKVDFLTTLQDMANNAVDLVNELINKLNDIPGVNLNTVSQLTFGVEAQVANEAAKQARNERNADKVAEIQDNITGRQAAVDDMTYQANEEHLTRLQKIYQLQNEKAANMKAKETPTPTPELSQIASNTKDIKDAVELSGEDLKYLREFAETDIINRFTTAEIKVDFKNYNQVNSNMDLDGVSTQLRGLIEKEMQSAAEGAH